MRLIDSKLGDVIKDTLNFEWVFILHKGKLYLYPLDYYNNGRLSESKEKGLCSFLQDPETWDLTKIKVIRNIYD